MPKHGTSWDDVTIVFVKGDVNIMCPCTKVKVAGCIYGEDVTSMYPC
jgi:hypothetical protein